MLGASGGSLRAGFTLIELIVVIVILSLIFAVAVPVLDNIAPEYSLRAGARQVGALIHLARSSAGANRERYILRYDLAKNSSWLVLPPGKDEDPEQPIDEREALEAIDLPRHVVMEKVVLPDGTQVEDDKVDLVFDPLGFEGSHIVYLRNSEEAMIAVKYNALLGAVDYFKEPVEFTEF